MWHVALPRYLKGLCKPKTWNVAIPWWVLDYFINGILLYSCDLIRKGLRISDTECDIHIKDVVNTYLLITNSLSKHIFRSVPYFNYFTNIDKILNFKWNVILVWITEAKINNAWLSTIFSPPLLANSPPAPTSVEIQPLGFIRDDLGTEPHSESKKSQHD